jgi:hypothetical protein
MKLFLDDHRDAPAGWTKATRPKEVISSILQGEAEIIDLGYHLGNDSKYTGLTVLKWLQNEIGEGRIPSRVPEIWIHTSDKEAREIMEDVRSRIYKWTGRVVAYQDVAGRPAQKSKSRAAPVKM